MSNPDFPWVNIGFSERGVSLLWSLNKIDENLKKFVNAAGNV